MEDEDEILREFQDLQSEIREDKIKLELDPVVSHFVERLFEPGGWYCYSHIILNCLAKNSLIYYSNATLDKDKLVELLDRSFTESSVFFADILSKYLNQCEIEASQNYSAPLDLFQNFVDQGALRLLSECLEYCSFCDEMKIVEVKRRRNECSECQSQLFHIMQSSVPDAVRSSISNGQILELYVKKSLQRSGFHIS